MKELTTIEDMRRIVESTSASPVFLFKHSTICPISARASARLNDYLAQAGASTPDVYLINVIESRPVSNAIAEDLGVVHASPQLLLVKDGNAVWNTSHGNIRAETIDDALGEFAPSM